MVVPRSLAAAKVRAVPLPPGIKSATCFWPRGERALDKNHNPARQPNLLSEIAFRQAGASSTNSSKVFGKFLRDH